MVSSHFTGPGPGMKLEIGPGTMVSDMLCRNVHACLRQGHGTGAIASYWASPILCTGPGS